MTVGRPGNKRIRPSPTKSLDGFKQPAAVKKPRKYTESIIQAEAVRRLSALGVFVMMIPNGEITQMTARKFMRLVALGFRAGAPDTILIEKQTARAFHLEFKQPGGKQSPNQVAFEELCGRNGWEYACVDSADKALEAAEKWGLIHRGETVHCAANPIL